MYLQIMMNDFKVCELNRKLLPILLQRSFDDKFDLSRVWFELISNFDADSSYQNVHQMSKLQKWEKRKQRA